MKSGELLLNDDYGAMFEDSGSNAQTVPTDTKVRVTVNKQDVTIGLVTFYTSASVATVTPIDESGEPVTEEVHAIESS